MGEPLPVPPPGFDDLNVGQKIDYLHALWSRIARDEHAVPSPEWHRDLVRQSLAEHRANPREGEPWPEVRADLESRLKKA